MTSYAIIAVVAVVAVLAALVHIAVCPTPRGNPLLALLMALAFALYTALTIATEGPVGFWPNHTANLWGVQVWIDLISSVTLATLFIAPRAREVGMRVPLWIVLVAATASIGLFAMAARLFWLEQRQR
jgi:hypothetical protein